MEIKPDIWEQIKKQAEGLSNASLELAEIRQEFEKRTEALQLKVTRATMMLDTLIGIAEQG